MPELEEDILILELSNDETLTVPLPAGTFNKFEERANQEGVPFNEDFIVNILMKALEHEEKQQL
jgi:hypothetical protein